MLWTQDWLNLNMHWVGVLSFGDGAEMQYFIFKMPGLSLFAPTLKSSFIMIYSF